MLDLDVPELTRLVEEQAYAPLFVTVSGAHLYGFPRLTATSICAVPTCCPCGRSSA